MRVIPLLHVDVGLCFENESLVLCGGHDESESMFDFLLGNWNDERDLIEGDHLLLGALGVLQVEWEEEHLFLLELVSFAGTLLERTLHEELVYPAEKEN